MLLKVTFNTLQNNQILRSVLEITIHLSNLRHLHISHNAPYLRPKILHNLCFSFLLGITAIPREIENNAYTKFWGANKVHFGRHASGVDNPM